MMSNPLKKISKKLTLIDLLGTVWTEKSHDEWVNDFIKWLENRGEYVFMESNISTSTEEIRIVINKLLDKNEEIIR